MNCFCILKISFKQILNHLKEKRKRKKKREKRKEKKNKRKFETKFFILILIFHSYSLSLFFTIILYPNSLKHHSIFYPIPQKKKTKKTKKQKTKKQKTKKQKHKKTKKNKKKQKKKKKKTKNKKQKTKIKNLILFPIPLGKINQTMRRNSSTSKTIIIKINTIFFSNTFHSFKHWSNSFCSEFLFVEFEFVDWFF